VYPKNHALIITGPYAFIRHPSYTGLIMTIVGACCSQAKGSWVRECGLLEDINGSDLDCYMVAIAGAVVVSLLLRIPNEDKLLHTKFGEEWRCGRVRVHYKLGSLHVLVSYFQLIQRLEMSLKKMPDHQRITEQAWQVNFTSKLDACNSLHHDQ